MRVSLVQREIINTSDGYVFMNILVHASNASTIRKYFKQMLQKEPTLTQRTFPSQSQPDLSIKAFKVSIPPNGVIISD